MSKYRLRLYEADDETVSAEWSTDPGHPTPYVITPGSHAESEIDLARGAATIGQITASVADVATVEGDQASGHVTAALADEVGRSAIIGRRAEWSEDRGAGFQTVLDGVVGTASLRRSFAGYDFAIRDIRERERKARAFLASSTAILPRGPVHGYGWTGRGWIAPPVAPIRGTFRRASATVGKVDVSFGLRLDRIVTDRMTKATQYAWDPDIGWYFPTAAVWWRPAAGGAWRKHENMPAPPSNLPIDREYARGMLYTRATTVRVNGRDQEAEVVHRVLITATPEEAIPADGASIDVLVVYNGPPTEDWPLHIEGITAGELLKRLYDGEYSDTPPRIRYDAAALLALREPVRARITAPVDDLREWTERYVYAPLGAAPALDGQGRVSPVRYALPGPDVLLAELNNSNCAPLPGWEHTGSDAVTHVTSEYARDFAVRVQDDPLGTSSAGDGITSRAVKVLEYDSASVALLGKRTLDVSLDLFRAVGGAIGEPVTGDATDETAHQLARQRGQQALDRFALGGQHFALRARRNDATVEALRVGDWALVACSWLPEYTTGRRGANRLAQVVSRKDSSPAWTELSLIDAGPAHQPLGQPTLGTPTVSLDGVVTVPITSVPVGGEARVYYAVSDTLPDNDSGLWTYAGPVRSLAEAAVQTPPLPSGSTAWIRARGEGKGRRPSAYTNAVSVAVPAAIRLHSAVLEVADDGTVTVRWSATAATLGVRIYYTVGVEGGTPRLDTHADFSAAAGEAAPFVLLPGETATVAVEAWSGWTGSAVAGVAGGSVALTANRTAEGGGGGGGPAAGTWVILTGTRWVPVGSHGSRTFLNVLAAWGADVGSLLVSYPDPAGGVVSYVWTPSPGMTNGVLLIESATGAVREWAPTEGGATVTVTPYSEPGAGGEAGPSQQITPPNLASTGEAIGIRLGGGGLPGPAQADRLVLGTSLGAEVDTDGRLVARVTNVGLTQIPALYPLAGGRYLRTVAPGAVEYVEGIPWADLQLAGAPAFVTRWPTWTEVANKPTSFPAAAHALDGPEHTGLLPPSRGGLGVALTGPYATGSLPVWTGGGFALAEPPGVDLVPHSAPGGVQWRAVSGTLPTAPGAAGHTLRTNGTTGWTPSSLRWPDALTTGELLHGSATGEVQRLGPGTPGQVLRTGGAAPGALPYWGMPTPAELGALSLAGGTVSGVVHAARLTAGAVSGPALIEARPPHQVDQDAEIRIGSGSSFNGLGLNYRLGPTGSPSQRIVVYGAGVRYDAITLGVSSASLNGSLAWGGGVAIPHSSAVELTSHTHALDSARITGVLPASKGGLGVPSLAAGLVRSDGSAYHSGGLGSTGQVWTMVGPSLMGWAAVAGTLPATPGGTGHVLRTGAAGAAAWSALQWPDALTRGELLFGGAGVAVQRLGVGTAGQVLRTGGLGADPAWHTLTAADVGAAAAAHHHDERYSLLAHAHDLAGAGITGQLPIARGGTGATSLPSGLIRSDGAGLLSIGTGSAGQVVGVLGGGAGIGWITVAGTLPTAPGAAGHTLRTNGTTGWVASALRWPDAVSHGDVLVGGAGGEVVRLLPGTSGLVLRTAGIGAAPYWGMPTPAELGALSLAGGSLTGLLYAPKLHGGPAPSIGATGAALEIRATHTFSQDEELRIGSYFSGNFFGVALNYRINAAGGTSQHLVAYSAGSRFTHLSFAGSGITTGGALTVGGALGWGGGAAIAHSNLVSLTSHTHALDGSAITGVLPSSKGGIGAASLPAGLVRSDGSAYHSGGLGSTGQVWGMVGPALMGWTTIAGVLPAAGLSGAVLQSDGSTWAARVRLPTTAQIGQLLVGVATGQFGAFTPASSGYLHYDLGGAGWAIAPSVVAASLAANGLTLASPASSGLQLTAPGGTAEVSIQLRTAGGTSQGYVYGAGGSVGLLDAPGTGWLVQASSSGITLHKPVNVLGAVTVQGSVTATSFFTT